MSCVNFQNFWKIFARFKVSHAAATRIMQKFITAGGNELFMDWIFLLLAAASGLVFTLGDILLKYWSNSNNHYLLGAGFAVYLIAGLLLALSFKRKEIAVAVAVLICFNLITVAILGFTLFREALGLKEVIGISLAITAVILLNV